MRIWHFGASCSPREVNGVSALAWTLAREQARLGHAVVLFCDGPIELPAGDLEEWAGLPMHPSGRGPLRYKGGAVRSGLASARPDIVHMHSVFTPAQASLAVALRRKSIPYVVTPNGGLSPDAFLRHRLRKEVYWTLVERTRLAGATGCIAVSPGEIAEIKNRLRASDMPIEWIANPVSADELDADSWAYRAPPHRLVFLGRFDVLHKGIDRLVALGCHLPGIEISLHGTSNPGKSRPFDEVRRNAPRNVRFLPPVHGRAKSQALRDATLYIQYSRWEGFPVSVAEAMYGGTPCALTASLKCAQLFRDHELGLLLPEEPKDAAATIKEVLATPEVLRRWSRNGVRFAETHFMPRTIANRYIAFYERVIARRSGRTAAISSSSHPASEEGAS